MKKTEDERKILRAIYGGVNAEEGWRRRTVKELETLYKETKITTVAKAIRNKRWRVVDCLKWP